MLWTIMGILSWLVFILTKDRRSIKKSILAGVVAILIQLFVDILAIKNNLYAIYSSDTLLNNKVPLWYTLGIVFPMGTLFVYHLPVGRFLKFIHIIVFTVLFWFAENILQSVGYLQYINWSNILSLGVNLLVFMSLAFLGENLGLRGGD